MKRILSLFAVIAMILSLFGCSSGENNTVTFYYCRNPEFYQYFEEDAVIHAESREILAHRNDLKYMLSLYMAGPMEEGLSIPFTKSTKLLSVEQKQDVISIELSDHSKTLSDAEFSLACAGLTLTCMNLTQCREVTIVSGDRAITMNSDNILLYDPLHTKDTTGG